MTLDNVRPALSAWIVHPSEIKMHVSVLRAWSLGWSLKLWLDPLGGFAKLNFSYAPLQSSQSLSAMTC